MMKAVRITPVAAIETFHRTGLEIQTAKNAKTAKAREFYFFAHFAVFAVKKKSSGNQGGNQHLCGCWHQRSRKTVVFMQPQWLPPVKESCRKHARSFARESHRYL